MKTLIVYSTNSVFKYPRLYEEFMYNIADNKALIIYKRNPINGEEDEASVFMKWDYFLIEEEKDE